MNALRSAPARHLINTILAEQPAEDPMRNPHPFVERLRGLYSPPNAATLASSLPDIGDSLSAQFAELARGPTLDRCEHLSIQLQGAARHVLALREAVQREDSAR
jgi:hypothetical protein